MEQASMPVLSGWMNFYEVVGSSAGALTGLQFVVITLIANSRVKGSMREIRAFGTPTMTQFCVALLISAVMSAPWEALWPLAICIGVLGAVGLAYSIRVIWHAREASYNPDLEDWIWYAALPLVGYASLCAATVSLLLLRHPEISLFGIGATALLMLFVGVHNSWDTVTYVVTQHRQKAGEGQDPAATPQ